MSDDPVTIQVNIRAKTPHGKKLGKRALQEAVERWAYTGRESPFLEIRAVHWLNPERRTAALARWKVATAPDVTPSEYASLAIAGESRTGDTIEQARRSLRLASMPPGAFAAMLHIVGVRPRRERKTGRKKTVKKQARKVSKVRRPKRKNKKK